MKPNMSEEHSHYRDYSAAVLSNNYHFFLTLPYWLSANQLGLNYQYNNVCQDQHFLKKRSVRRQAGCLRLLLPSYCPLHPKILKHFR